MSFLGRRSNLSGCHESRTTATRRSAVVLAVVAVTTMATSTPAEAGAPDRTAPQLADFEISATTVDLTLGTGSVTVTAHVTDDLSGIQTVQIWGIPDLPEGVRKPGLAHQKFSLASGTPNDATYTGIFQVPTYSPNGIQAVGLVLEDRIGNLNYLDNVSHLEISGSTGRVDKSAPMVTSFAQDQSAVDVTQGPAAITVAADILDDLSGVQVVEVHADRIPDEQTDVHAHEMTVLSLSSGTARNGRYSGSLNLAQNALSGSYRISVYLVDAIGRTCRVDEIGRVAVTGSVGKDSAAPILELLDPNTVTVDVSAGTATAEFSAHVTDNIAGVRTVSALAYYTDQGQTLARSSAELTRVSGSLHDGIYTGSLQVSEFAPDGLYRVAVSAIDALGNSYSNHALGALRVIRSSDPVVE